ncbi:MAP kinase-activated protein kinase 2 [Acromyrmex echinatior]|uniref:MAP kinase-activated protein kinase 2 n=1 Tax=Acromyrmex echinatior TaxID=103372 RepID=F4X1P0_ACREC|nr:MAP kinase-activated protein kinase 2 [Acromyrmex echinatior]
MTEYPRLCRKSRRAVLEENEQESKRKCSIPSVVVTQVIRQDYDQLPEQKIPEVEDAKRKTMEHPLNNRLSPKATPITDDYEISNHVLGLGINGKVVQCYDKNTRQKYALKFEETPSLIREIAV